MEESKYKYSYMSGVDTTIFLNGKEVGGIQAISFTTQREKVLQYVMGSPTAKGVSRGKVAVGGSVVALTMHEKALKEALQGWILTNNSGEITKLQSYNDKDRYNIDSETFFDPATDTQSLNQTVGPIGEIVRDTKLLAKSWRLDQLPACDILLLNMNEHGYASVCIISGVEFVNSGNSASIDDINMAETYTFVATSVTGWEPVTDETTISGTSIKNWLLDKNKDVNNISN